MALDRARARPMGRANLPELTAVADFTLVAQKYAGRALGNLAATGNLQK